MGEGLGAAQTRLGLSLGLFSLSQTWAYLYQRKLRGVRGERRSGCISKRVAGSRVVHWQCGDVQAHGNHAARLPLECECQERPDATARRAQCRGRPQEDLFPGQKLTEMQVPHALQPWQVFLDDGMVWRRAR